VDIHGVQDGVEVGNAYGSAGLFRGGRHPRHLSGRRGIDRVQVHGVVSREYKGQSSAEEEQAR
jgi:hypothetical protein